MLKRFLTTILLFSLTLTAWAERPKLGVVIVCDQLRAEQLLRLGPYFLPPVRADGRPGGFRYLMERGADHRQCFYGALPTKTGVGHATVSTGAYPGHHGIVGNRWVDFETKEWVEAVADPEYPVIGAKPGVGASPLNLVGSTLADQVKMATRGRGKVVTVSMKDRAAIFLAGHQADLALWYDNKQGRWTSSRFYRPDGTLPDWVQQVNELVESLYGTVWEQSNLEVDLVTRDLDQPGAAGDYGLGYSFPHPVGGERSDFYKAVQFIPQGNEMTLQAAALAVTEERLGKGDRDLLCISLSAGDRAGHLWGPNSPEVADVLLESDRALADFLAKLDDEVGLENCLIGLTGDHGGAPLPEIAQQARLGGGRLAGKEIEAAAEQVLDRVLPGAKVVGYSDPNLYLDLNGFSEEQKESARKAVRIGVEALPGMFAAYTRGQVEEGRMPRAPVADMVSLGYFRERCGALFLVKEPYWVKDFPEPKGTGHGSPWTFDTHVPLLLAGPGVRPGVRFGRCAPVDLAATFSALMEIGMPSGCVGEVLDSVR